jgi:non-specific serine/threonine protein kinase
MKQICNHPAQYLNTGAFTPAESGKFERLRQICDEIAERQEKLLVFTQFLALTQPLADFLAGVFGRPGLVLHGGTPVGKRSELVKQFQADDGPPFFVISLKAGGSGLNLTAASHVVHFDRWWNPAVEDQATDRAYRIGQTRAVQVHKMVCAGTVEEKIDGLLEHKRKLAAKVVGAGESWITELGTSELRELFALGAGAVVEGDDGGDDDGDDDGVDGDGGQRHADDAHDENGTPGARPQRGASGAPREGKGAPAATVAARAPGRRRRQAPPRTGQGKRPGAGA